MRHRLVTIVVVLAALATMATMLAVAPSLNDFRDVRRAGDISVGMDLGGTAHSSINFAGSIGSAGDTWITVYDTTPGSADQVTTFGPVSLSADVLIHPFNNKKGAGLLALFNEAPTKKGLALMVFDNGNTDSLVLGTVSKSAGQFAPLATVSLGAGIAENAWYRVTLDVAVNDTLTITGKVFRHSSPGNPDSALGTQVGSTLSSTGGRPNGVDATGEVGIVAAATSAVVDSSVTNFTVVDNRLPPPPANSCVGTTATVIQPLLYPNGSVRVVVPSGQQSAIVIQSTDHSTDVTTTFNYTVGPGTTVLTVPIACFPLVEVKCGSVIVDSVRGENQCPT